MRPELEKAVETLLKGGVVAFPTDTVWGVLVRPDDPAAVERVYAMKGRPKSQPLQLLVADLEAATGLLPKDYRDPRFFALAERFWPGPLTLVVPAGRPFPAIGARERVGLRIPNHPELQALLRALGGFLAATSLNPSGAPPVQSAEEAARFPVDHLVLGTPGAGRASSVVDLVEGRILRADAIPETELLPYLEPA